MGSTVDARAVPNLAYSAKPAGKSTPLSQILAPPVMCPEPGFTSVRVGPHSPSVLGVLITRWGIVVLNESGVASVFRNGPEGPIKDGELDELASWC